MEEKTIERKKKERWKTIDIKQGWESESEIARSAGKNEIREGT